MFFERKLFLLCKNIFLNAYNYLSRIRNLSFLDHSSSGIGHAPGHHIVCAGLNLMGRFGVGLLGLLL